MQFSNETLDLILGMLIKHEDETSLTREELWACVSVAQAAKAPQYITEHFATKAVSKTMVRRIRRSDIHP